MTSYGDDEGFLEWLSAQGLTLPEDAPTPAVLRQIGSAYVDAAYGYKLTCSRRTGGWEQELEFPRIGHYVNGQLLPSTLIPTAWVHASYRAAWLNATTPGWSTNAVDGSRLTKTEKVDVISREFFAPGDANSSDVAPGVPTDSIINGMVLPFLCTAGRDLNALFRVV